MNANAGRELAVRAVASFTEKGTFLSDRLESGLGELAPVDRGLCTEIAYGTVERLRLIDYNLAHFLHAGLARFEPIPLAILRTALYQLYFLERVPAYSVCDEAVELAKKLCSRKVSGLVNAVVRRAGREKLRLSGKFAVDCSLSDSLAERLCALFGEKEARVMMDAALRRRPLTVVVNNMKISTEDYCNLLKQNGIIPTVIEENLLELPNAGAVPGLPGFSEGLFHVQDTASFLACELLELRPGERCGDFCAAPGGKSFTSFGRAQGRAELWAFDLSEKKVRLIREGAKRLGYPIHTSAHSAKETDHPVPELDKIICDVPCSGFGVLGKKPEIRYKELAEVERLPEIQLEILENVSRYLRPGGALLYSTCTILPEENRAVVDRFLSAHPEFTLVPCRKYLPERFCKETEDLTLLPQDGTDGFYMARLRRVK